MYGTIGGSLKRGDLFLKCRPCLRLRFFRKITPRVDSSVALTHHDPRDLGLICLVKKRKIRFRFLSDLRFQSWIEERNAPFVFGRGRLITASVTSHSNRSGLWVGHSLWSQYIRYCRYTCILIGRWCTSVVVRVWKLSVVHCL